MAERTYDSPPSTIELFARAGAAMIPGASRLPFVGGGGKDIPDLTLALNDIALERAEVERYSLLCGFKPSEVLPPTYPHILAFPLHLSLMTDSSFPFAAIGLVHISNEITQKRPISASEVLSLRVHATPLEPHPRGRQFSVHTEAQVNGEIVWEEVSTNLKRGGGSGGRSEREQRDELPATDTWTLPGDLGRQYASVAGDYNPIHIHPLTARLFGFPSAIAHGMWTKARCLAALHDELADAFSVRVEFRKPILLPATVEFAHEGDRFEVRDQRKGSSHLQGTLTSAV